MDGDGRDDLAYLTGFGVSISGFFSYVYPYYMDLPGVNIVVRRSTSSAGSLSFDTPISSYWSWDIIDFYPPGLSFIPPSVSPEFDWFGYLYYYNLNFYQTPTDGWLSKGGDVNRDGRQELNLTFSYGLRYVPRWWGGTHQLGLYPGELPGHVPGESV